jgi:hypothetical protein
LLKTANIAACCIAIAISEIQANRSEVVVGRFAPTGSPVEPDLLCLLRTLNPLLHFALETAKHKNSPRTPVEHDTIGKIVVRGNIVDNQVAIGRPSNKPKTALLAANVPRRDDVQGMALAVAEEMAPARTTGRRRGDAVKVLRSDRQ